MEFLYPETIEEAEERLKKLFEELGDLDQQLRITDKKDGNGNRLSSAEYWEWRNQLGQEKRKKMGEKNMLNEWKQDYLRKANGKGMIPKTTIGFLQATYQLLIMLKDEDVEFDEKELALIEAIEGHLKTHKY